MRAVIEFCNCPSSVPPTSIVIRDVGHDQGAPSVTNDAENVVATLIRIMRQLKEPLTTRLFYYDSDGHLDELCHDGTQFTHFATGPR